MFWNENQNAGIPDIFILELAPHFAFAGRGQIVAD
jgi:hypothetical protein